MLRQKTKTTGTLTRVDVRSGYDHETSPAQSHLHAIFNNRAKRSGACAAMNFVAPSFHLDSYFSDLESDDRKVLDKKRGMNTTPDAGRAEAEFDRLYGEHQPLIRRFLAARLGGESDADDLVQETFLRYRKVSETETVENSRALLFKIARNLSVDHIRKQSRASTRDKAWAGLRMDTVPDDVVDITPDPESVLASRQQLDRVVAILDNLSPKVREAFTLHKFEGLPYKDVAARMGIARSTVEKHMIKALRKLSDGLRED